MQNILLSILCGLLGVLVAVLAGLFFLFRTMPRGFMRILPPDKEPERYKDVEVLEHAARPQGLYVRFKNIGSKPTELAYFRVRSFKDGKLWIDLEETIYSHTNPGEEQEGILKLRDYSEEYKTFDLSDSRVEVKFLYAYVASTMPA